MVKKIKELQKPDGPFNIGRVHLNFVDKNRIDPFPLAKGKNRDVPVIIWYPIDKSNNSHRLRLIKRQDLKSLKALSLYKLIPKRLCEILTNSYEDAIISDRVSNFPLLIFNHGFSSFMEQNTLLMEHLTSYGYIVASVGHPYDGVASYPDGRSIPMDVKIFKSSKKKLRKKMKIALGIMKNLETENLTIEEIKKYTENYSVYTENYGSYGIEIWIDDIIFITNILEKMNKGSFNSQFTQKIAFDKGVGVFGHSLGGAASIFSCCLDNRLKCGINMDGTMFGGLKEKYKYNKPYMYMNCDWLANMNKYFYHINTNDSYYLTVKDSKHGDYSDGTYLLKNWFKKLAPTYGKIDGNQMIKIVNNYVQAFFDKYIKGIDSSMLNNNPYEEVILEKKTKK